MEATVDSKCIKTVCERKLSRKAMSVSVEEIEMRILEVGNGK